jgi:hypothetical protein
MNHLFVITFQACLWSEMAQPLMHVCVQLQILCVTENEGAVETMKRWATSQLLKYRADKFHAQGIHP